MKLPLFAISMTGLLACTPETETPILDGLPPAWTQTDAVDFSDSRPIPPDWLSTDAPRDIVPKLGTIGVRSNRGEAFWQTVDLSVGAIDTTARFELESGVATLNLIAYAPEDQFLDGIRQLRIKATFGTVGPGTATTATLTIADSTGDSIRSTTTDDLHIMLTRASQNVQGGYGQVIGTLSGTLCDTSPADPMCRPITGNFDTDAWVPD